MGLMGLMRPRRPKPNTKKISRKDAKAQRLRLRQTNTQSDQKGRFRDEQPTSGKPAISTSHPYPNLCVFA
jgi:hypothetical protein